MRDGLVGLRVSIDGRRASGYQLGPRLDGRRSSQRGEIDTDALAGPATGQCHHPDRVEALADEVATCVNGVGGDAEQVGYLGTDILRARRGTHHEPSLN